MRVVERLEELRGERDRWIDAPVRADELSRSLKALGASLDEAAREVHETRVAAARKLEKAVGRELSDLGMKRAALEVRIEAVEPEGGAPTGPKGRDAVRFLLAANPGEQPRPLDKAASGGELARILLALTRIAGGAVQTPVVLFDEVDAGIGGAVAEVVGRKLKEIASDHQVLCITHLPQIASQGDQHFTVAKNVRGGRTLASVDEVQGRDRVEEIARMLGGVELTSKAMAHAEEMLTR